MDLDLFRRKVADARWGWPRLGGVLAFALVLSAANGSLVHAADAPKSGSTMVVKAPPSAMRWKGAHRERRRFKPGMVVLDRRGSRVGLIIKTNQTKDGRPAIRILVNGTPITVRQSKFRLSRDGEEAVISLTRSQIRTAAILNTF